MNSKSNEVHTMLVVYFISKSHQSNIKKIKSNNGSQNLFYLSFDTCFATCFARRGRVPQSRTCRTACIKSNNGSQNLFYLSFDTCFARRGPQSRTCRIAKQRYSMSSKNSFYLSYDMPQSRTCRTAALVLKAITVHRTYFIYHSTPASQGEGRKAEHVV
jgi:hypothetical protein